MASKLMHRGPYEAMDELENSLLQSFLSLQLQLNPPYQIPSQSSVQLAHLNQALLYGMLTQPQVSQSLITHLAAVTSDGYASFVSILLRLVNECYPKLLDQSRAQLLWLFRQLIELSASDVENLCLSLLRNVVGGDISQGNVWLAAQLLDILRSNWNWLIGNPGLLTNALFTYLRLLPDHCMAKNPTLNELRQDEIAFCVQILRDCFQDCLVIGRDLVRLLQDVASIPEFESIWRDLLSNPTAFKAAGFADIAQLYVVRTPTRYLQSRITPEMEAQIRFMLTHVRWGSQRRYQTWFTQRFFSTPGSETLVCDLIRFICCVHHPTNQILQSDIVPRWAIVGWLLKCCKSNHVEANAKLALFYDWLFFMSKTDNIMNIEPALLLMVHSIPKYMDMTHSLLEFLFLSMEHYDPSRKDLIHRGVVTSVDILVGKGVVRSLEPLSACSLVAPWLREKLTMYFPKYCKPDSSDVLKHEILQQESLFVSPVSHGGVRNSVLAQSGSPVKIESSGADMTFSGNHNQVVDTAGISHPDLRINDGLTDTMPRKRRRIDILTIKDLVEALTRSQEEAVNVLEKLLILFLSGDDSSTTEKNKDLAKVEAGFDTMVDYCAGSSGQFAHQISDVLKGGGYDLFPPLCGHPSDTPEGDEIMSLTSVVLRLYIQSHHPQLLRILLSWYHEGFAVGARLLCYVCRLAEDLLQSSSSTFVSKNCSAEVTGFESAVVIGSSVNQDGESALGSFRSRDGQGNSNGQLGAQKRIDIEGTSAFLWHKSIQNNVWHKGIRKATHNHASEATSDLQACWQSTVAHAFGAYEEYLKQTRKKSLPASQGGVSSQSCIVDKFSLANGTPKVEDKDATDDESESALLEDLETCLAWNMHRLLMVLPWVFGHLPQLSTGKEEIIRLLVSVLDPMELSKFELKLSLKEISVFGMQPVYVVKLIKNSLQWDCFEQQYFWRLLIAELQSLAAPFAVELVKNCTAFLEPSTHYEAMSGLLLFLKLQCPTTQLVLTVVLLPQEFGRFVAAVLASWVSMDIGTFFGSLKSLMQQNLKTDQEQSENFEHHGSFLENLNTTALSYLFSFLENYIKRNNALDDNMKVEANQIKHVLLELARTSGPKGTTFLQGTVAKSEEN